MEERDTKEETDPSADRRENVEPHYSKAVLKIIDEIEKNAYGRPPKPKPVPKDFIKENKKILKQMQVKNIEKKASQPLKITKRFSTVKSRVYDAKHTTAKACCEEGVVKKARCSSCSPYKQPQKLTVPHPLGYMPPYIEEKKKVQKEMLRALQEEDEKTAIPPGHILLSEEERIQTVESLQKIQEELMFALTRLPIQCDTLRRCQRKEDLEKRLTKVEEGLNIFNKPKVFVRTDI